jgi:hypothetical protein
VSQPTISRDFAAIDQQWREKANPDDIAVVKGKDAEMVEELIKAIWLQAVDPDNKSQTFYIDRVIALLERRAKLLGLDAPLRIDRALTEYAKELARDNGWDEHEAVAEAQRLLVEAKSRG